jgi:hypothetical protein
LRSLVRALRIHQSMLHVCVHSRGHRSVSDAMKFVRPGFDDIDAAGVSP